MSIKIIGKNGTAPHCRHYSPYQKLILTLAVSQASHGSRRGDVALPLPPRPPHPPRPPRSPYKYRTWWASFGLLTSHHHPSLQLPSSIFGLPSHLWFLVWENLLSSGGIAPLRLNHFYFFWKWVFLVVGCAIHPEFHWFFLL